MSKAKEMTKWLNEHYIEILGSWPGNSLDLNYSEDLLSIFKKRIHKQKPRSLIRWEWVAIIQDLSQYLIYSLLKQVSENSNM